MRRREILGLFASAVAAPNLLHAQEGRLKLVGVLFGTTRARAADLLEAFRSGMRERGLSEDRDFSLIVRYSDGYNDRFPDLARELVAQRATVVVTGASVSTLAVIAASSTTPVVCAATFDATGLGLAANDARPGGQVTGLHWSIDSLPGKQLETIREIAPRAKNIGVLVQRGTVTMARLSTAAQAMGVELASVRVRAPEELNSAFETLAVRGANAVLVPGGPMFRSEQQRIITLAAERQWPLLAGWREFVEAGALVSYGVNLRDSFRRCAYYVERILRGDKAGDLPIELPSLELVINVRAAKALGLTIPPTLLARADEVIE